MKTAEDLAWYIDGNSSCEYGTEIDYVEILPIIKQFESEIRKDQVNKCAKAFKDVRVGYDWGGLQELRNAGRKAILNTIKEDI